MDNRFVIQQSLDYIEENLRGRIAGASWILNWQSGMPGYTIPVTQPQRYSRSLLRRPGRPGWIYSGTYSGGMTVWQP